MFRIGQRVICVDDDYPNEVWEVAHTVPEKGGIYTVREAYYSTSSPDPRRRGWGYRFVEIVNPKGRYLEASFMEWRFRPLRPDELTNDESEEEVAEEMLIGAR